MMERLLRLCDHLTTENPIKNQAHSIASTSAQKSQQILPNLKDFPFYLVSYLQKYYNLMQP